MPNPSGPDRDDVPAPPASDQGSGTGAAPVEQHPDGDDQVTQIQPVDSDDETATAALAETPADADAVTEVIATEAAPGTDGSPERRFTAPGFDAGHTEVIPSVDDADTELIAQQSDDAGKAIPQQIPARVGTKLPSTVSRSWGWVMAVILIILALAVIAVLGTLWLTRETRQAASQEEHVRSTIQSFDIATQNGDLATLRSLTCGDIRDRYVNYDQKVWDETYRRIAAAKQYPVVASIDEVVVNDGHAEANVTAFMAYEPRVRSTRSFDLQFRDDQWKICQSHGS
ncbi:hypothetical protein [Mycolicibacter hiberniae]|uniref:Uncharacterized protein n=1 Tax=Mycolicibacter hiberniae TaxID=29314 RepID=A0A7I7XAU3_9MYCO|nr:hypothetical protein [Mycolicibacter hiberniae]MCV7087317.1 hypothetical protein [Mycolicibacter hiberniae]ORV67710.1 hypothetical protein AWC09_16160 [Mycolicibacter hiberniae]BBZ25468.1 hypothetical protein MHIB_38860 [Mycolicibacter hiberniae]